MTIIKRRHTGGFSIVPNAVSCDESVSLEARGLLGYLISKPDNWEVNILDLRRAGKGVGRDKIYRILKELVGAGYVTRKQPRDSDGKMLPMHYEVFDMVQEVPQAAPESDISPVTEKPEAAAEPRPHSPHTEKPYTEKPDAVLYKDNNKTDINNTDSHKTRERERENSSIDGDDKKTIKRQFTELEGGWPSRLSDSLEKAETQWNLLTDDGRHAALARRDDYIQACKDAGRSYSIALATYLKERMWVKLPEPSAKVGEPVVLNKYGHRWMAYRLWLLSQPRRNWKPSVFIQRQIDEGKGAAFSDVRQRAQFPSVAVMDADAENLKNLNLPPKSTVPSHDGFVQIEAGSDEFWAWCEWHEAKDYPWINPPDCIQWIWVPSVLPPAIETSAPTASDDETNDYLEATR